MRPAGHRLPTPELEQGEKQRSSNTITGTVSRNSSRTGGPRQEMVELLTSI
jgi:hypothetical protein